MYAQAPSSVSIIGRVGSSSTLSPVVSVGSAVTLDSFVNGGAGPFTYVWRKTGSGIPEATAASYVINPIAADSAGEYTVTVTSTSGSVTSNAVTITVRLPAPVISAHPAPLTLQAGGTISLSATAVGTAPFWFRWYREGLIVASNLVFANSDTFTKTNAQAGDAGSYTVRIAFGSTSDEAISNPALVTLATLPPVITQQPVSAAVVYLNSIIASVTADGRGSTLRYTWVKDGTPVAASTLGTLRQSVSPTSPQIAIGVFQPEYSGSYYVVVSNAAGQSVASNTMTLSVSSGIAITSQPSSQSITAGSTANFGVTATFGTPFPGAPRYQWRKNGVDISGATSALLAVSNAQTSDAGAYTVLIYYYYYLPGFTSALSVLSAPATLTVNAPVGVAPVIISQPVAQSVTSGSGVSFTVVAAGTPAPTYQWSKNAAPVAGATGATYTIPSTQPADAGNYTVAVTNSAGSVTSSAVALIITTASAPTITAQPTGQAGSTSGTSIFASVGAAANFTVSAAGAAPISYQWRKDGNVISGATAATVSLINLTSADAGSYSVVVSNSFGAVTSSAVVLTVTTGTAPTITVQPTSQTVPTGGAVTFSITASGSTPFLSYAWFRNGRLQPGMLPTFTLTNVTAVDAGDYYVRVANMTGESVVSQPFTLTVLAPTSAPAILSQPLAQTVPVGGSVAFLVSANGSPSPTYQWYKRGSGAIAGATGSSLNLAAVTTGDAGDYYAVAYNSSGSATSGDARLTVAAANTTIAPSIVQQPTAQNVLPGGNVTFTVIANGTPAPTYQWYFNGGAVGGATSPSFSLASTTSADTGSYYVRVINSAGTTESSAVLLSVLAAEDQLAITTQPASQMTPAGSSVTFVVSVKGPRTLNYQWFKDGQPLGGATQASLTLADVQNAQAGSYSVTVSTRLTAAQQIVTSAAATLTVTPVALAPTITTQPSGQNLALGATASFAVLAAGTVPLTYQWRKNGTPILGAIAATLTLANLSAADAASYTVVVSNAAGTATSNAATLTVATASAFAGTYFGRFNNNPGDRFALVIRADGSAIFLGHAASLFTGYIATNIKINPDGTFSADLTEIRSPANTPAGDALPGSPAVPIPAAATISLSGSVATGALTGGISGSALTLAAPKSPASGAARSAAGVYQTAALNSSAGGLTTIVDATGAAFVFSQTSAGVTAGTGTLNPATGQVAVTLADNSTATATLNAGTGAATATLTTPTKEIIAFSGLAEGVTRTDRLINIATRGSVSAADLMIAGFTITGTGSKPVMIRATGPTLNAFNLTGTLPNPKLELFRGQTKIQENDDWSPASNATDIAATAARAGAFPLSASVEAVLLTTLAPGGYTAQVSSVTGAAGVALVEVYDVGVGEATPTTPRLVNISTRAAVSGGNSLLIAGIVITGNAPKKVLIRATGPALTALGLPGAISDPLLELFNGPTVIRRNDNWSDSPAEAALITAAGNATGAFALTAGTKDAALLITLEPGSYTAQVSGVGSAAGIALVEVYEVP